MTSTAINTQAAAPQHPSMTMFVIACGKRGQEGTGERTEAMGDEKKKKEGTDARKREGKGKERKNEFKEKKTDEKWR